MASFDTNQFPLVELQAVSNAQNEWLALTVRVNAPTVVQDASPGLDPYAVLGGTVDGTLDVTLDAVFADGSLLDAIAPLDCILLSASPPTLTPALREQLPPKRVILAIAAAALGDDALRKQILTLHEEGYRILIDGPAPEGVPVPPSLRAVALDVAGDVPLPAGKTGLLALFGPHLARGVDSGQRLADSVRGGFEWFSGPWPLRPLASSKANDGTSRKRLLALLGLLARDAESRDIEALLKQDPALSYHLLKLVNSAAFALTTPITSFNQAINLLGRRQLQRWLQLLLYARQQADGLANPLLPLAALRAAQLEASCQMLGGSRDDQDLAFMTGVFSLLDVLFDMTMDEVVGALALAPAAEDALLRRGGHLGQQLRLVESGAPTADALAAAGITSAQWWQSQLHAYRWAIQVGRNL